MSFLFGSKVEEDDPSCLPDALRDSYLMPEKILEIENAAIRDVFRAFCIRYAVEFIGQKRSKYTWEQIRMAYHVVRGNLKGPAMVLNQQLPISPHLFVQPSHIIPSLKPMKCQDIQYKPDYRAFPMFSIVCIDARLSIPSVSYVFSVEYCMRQFIVTKTYNQCQELFVQLRNEILQNPSFPDSDPLSWLETGTKIAMFIQRVYDTLSSGRYFSPRIFEFFEIDYIRIHIEEEGRIIQFLDDPKNMASGECVWFAISESWLRKWRAYALSRDSRRYLPPGPVDNTDLYDVSTGLLLDTVKLVKDYRSVNYNVYAYYLMVHGVSKTFPPLSKVGKMQAIVMVQSYVRRYMASKRYSIMREMKITQDSLAARMELHEISLLEKRKQILVNIAKIQEERRLRRFTQASSLTQKIWRGKSKKANETLSNEQLKKINDTQTVFVRSGATNKEAAVVEADGLGKIIQEIQPTIALSYDDEAKYVICRDNILPFVFSKKSGTEKIIVTELQQDYDLTTEDHAEFMNSNDDDDEKDEQKNAFVNAGEIKCDSELVSVNDIPITTMSYIAAIDYINNLPFPYRLKFKPPPVGVQTRRLRDEDLGGMVSPLLGRSVAYRLDNLSEVDNIAMRVSIFKVILSSAANSNQINLIKHNLGLGKHATQIFIDDTHFYYKGKDSKKSAKSPTYGGSVYSSDSGSVSSTSSSPKSAKLLATAEWKAMSLYCLSFVRAGKVTAPLKKRSIDPELCFSIETDSRSLDFEVPHEYAQMIYLTCNRTPLGKEVAKSLVWGLTAIIKEIKASQWIVDESGTPIKRKQPRKMFRLIT